MSEPIPVLRYAGDKPRKPVGLIVLSVNLGAGVLLTMIGVTIDSLLLYQVCHWLYLGNLSLQPQMFAPFGLATLLGTGSLLAGIFLVFGVAKEIKLRRKRRDAQAAHIDAPLN